MPRAPGFPGFTALATIHSYGLYARSRCQKTIALRPLGNFFRERVVKLLPTGRLLRGAVDEQAGDRANMRREFTFYTLQPIRIEQHRSGMGTARCRRRRGGRSRGTRGNGV